MITVESILQNVDKNNADDPYSKIQFLSPQNNLYGSLCSNV